MPHFPEQTVSRQLFPDRVSERENHTRRVLFIIGRRTAHLPTQVLIAHVFSLHLCAVLCRAFRNRISYPWKDKRNPGVDKRFTKPHGGPACVPRRKLTVPYLDYTRDIGWNVSKPCRVCMYVATHSRGPYTSITDVPFDTRISTLCRVPFRQTPLQLFAYTEGACNLRIRGRLSLMLGITVKRQFWYRSLACWLRKCFFGKSAPQ